MKKVITLFAALICVCSLSACTPAGSSNLLLFTEKLNAVSDEKISLTDFVTDGSSYRTVFSRGNTELLLTAETNEKNEIKKMRLTISKIDETGSYKSPTDAEADFFRQKATLMLTAFTLFEKEKSTAITEKILPSKGEDLLRTGELTTDTDNFHIVYYSNRICCQFTVTNTFLEKTEITEKPVSRPLYEVTANVISED